MKYAFVLLTVALAAASPLLAQPATVEINPAQPSSADVIEIHVSGLSACPYLSTAAVQGPVVVLSFSLGLCLAPPTPFALTRYVAPLDPGQYTLVVLDAYLTSVIETIPFEVSDAGAPPVPAGDWLESAAVPGFRFKVRIADQSGGVRMGALEADCLPETLCASGAVAGRSEVLLRVVGPKPNGYLWPTFVRFTTSTVEIWVEKKATAEVKYYRLEGALPGLDTLDGGFDRSGFTP